MKRRLDRLQTLVNAIVEEDGLLGQLSANNLGTALILSPLAPVGIWLGVRFHRMLSESLFYTLCFVFLSLTGVKLIWDGLSGMMGG